MGVKVICVPSKLQVMPPGTISLVAKISIVKTSNAFWVAVLSIGEQDDDGGNVGAFGHRFEKEFAFGINVGVDAGGRTVLIGHGNGIERG